MHYVDVGEGRPVLLVHGTPTWPYLWRDLIADLSEDHHVVALDHIGFGLSDNDPHGLGERLDRRRARPLLS